MSEVRIAGPEVRFSGVSLALGGTQVLEDVEFDIRAGSLHCIVGPNGGGKTSLLRSLLGQMPYRGRIEIGWRDNRITGYVPQTLHFEPALPITVGNFMSMIDGDRPAFLGSGAAQTARIDAALAQVGMRDRKLHRFGSLSGGERQRILVAQALLPMPALLVLDEPMTGLDRAGSAAIEERVLGLKETGMTVVWVHHDLQHVQRIADTVTCINRRVTFHGAPREVLTPDNILTLFSSGAPTAPARNAAA
jgi:zinc transport system ATP-binding protein